MKSNKNSAWKAFALTVTMNVLWVGTCFSLPDEGPKKNGFGKKFKTIFLNKQESRPDSATGEPFAWGDFSWLQGNNRQRQSLLETKYFTGSITLDLNYNYHFNRPKDHTNAGSTATIRSSCLQYMPNDFITFGLEFVSRNTNVPYFSGRGGVTSPNGWNPPIRDPAPFTADLVKDESRIILSTIVRF